MENFCSDNVSFMFHYKQDNYLGKTLQDLQETSVDGTFHFQKLMKDYIGISFTKSSTEVTVIIWVQK
jgi:hypothetical protein